MPEKFMRPGEAAKKYRVSRCTLRRWHNQGKIHAAVMPSGHRRYKEASIRRHIGLSRRERSPSMLDIF